MSPLALMPLLSLLACDTPADPGDSADPGDTAAEDSGDSGEDTDTGDSGTDTDTGTDTGDSGTDTGDPPADADGDGVADDADCAPDNPLRFPGAEEQCDHADRDCDGSVLDGVRMQEVVGQNAAGTVNSLQRLTYDGEGHWLTRESGASSDPLPEYSEFEWDDWGVAVQRDSNDGDATTWELITWTWRDEQGRMVGLDVDFGGDGVVENWRTCTWAADGTGACEGDSTNAGEATWFELYDEHGTAYLYWTDVDRDGVAESTLSYLVEYDEHDELSRYGIDTDGDGVANVETRWERDTAGRVTRETRELTGDGVVDQTLSYAYGPDGLLFSYDYDFGSSGGQFRYTWDELDRSTGYTGDGDGSRDGVWETTRWITYAGPVKVITTDTQGTGTPQSTSTSTLTCD